MPRAVQSQRGTTDDRVKSVRVNFTVNAEGGASESQSRAAWSAAVSPPRSGDAPVKKLTRGALADT